MLSAFLSAWINMAVGIIGPGEHPANLFYFLVFIVGGLGSLISGFKAKGLSYTLYAMAIIQTLIPFVALAIWQPPMNTTEQIMGIAGTIMLSGFFGFLFAVSGFFFKKADKK